MYLSLVKASAVYDILIEYAGAQKDDKTNFVYHHCTTQHPCTEWRFCGWLGFGGKYRSDYNAVDCYKEDETAEIVEIIKKTNLELSKIQ